MIAVSLGMLAVAAVGSVFITGSRNYKQDDKTSRMQDELRFAMAQLSQDLEMAGFHAQIRDPLNDIDVDSSATLDSDCGPSPGAGLTWTYNERRASVFTRGNATAADANTTFPCVSTAEFKPGTDVIAIKRLSGTVVTAPQAGKIYLKTNGIQSTVYKHPAAPPPTTNFEIYEFRPVVWYIRNYSVSANENPKIPSLCRKVLTGGANPTMQSDTDGCIASGIEDMQLEFGLEDSAIPDGVPDYFTEFSADPGIATMVKVVAVRIHLLARSSDVDRNYKNAKTYQLAGTTHAATNDGYYRKTLSSVVLLRNPAHLLTPYALPQ